MTTLRNVMPPSIVYPIAVRYARELDIVETVGRLGVSPSLPRPVIGTPRPDSPAYRAGLRTFDTITQEIGRAHV